MWGAIGYPRIDVASSRGSQLLRKFIAAHQQVASESPVSQEAVRPEVMDAYFESITEREEVYRRLADS
jgi:hypothetical protein